jgi:hypothetical protein
MPIMRYIAWVGTSLLALLFVANWFLPEYSAEPTPNVSNRPVIRIASIQQPPERIDIDTSRPTIVPPQTLFGDAVPATPTPLLESYASATPAATVVNPDQKKRKVVDGKCLKLRPTNQDWRAPLWWRVATRRQQSSQPDYPSQILFLCA